MQMKMINKLFIYLTVLLVFSACSDDDFILPGTITPDGELTLMINVPDMTFIRTRATADPDLVNDLTVLVLSNTGKVLQVKTFSGSEKPTFAGGKTTVNLKLDSEARANVVDIAVIANMPSSITPAKGNDYATIESTAFNADPMNATVISMSGVSKLSDIVGGASIPLFRNVAMVSAMAATEKADGDYIEGTVYPVRVYGGATSVVVAGTEQDGVADWPAEDESFSEVANQLMNPTSVVGNRPYAILKVPYGSNKKEYYYRVNFEKIKEDKDGNKTVEPLAVERNHHYKVYVTEVKGEGYESPLEAAKNPGSLLETDIIDVCLDSYNMVTDGVRELGVSNKIVFKGAASGVADDWTQTEDLHIKIYSPNESELTFSTANVVFDCDWLEIKNCEETSANNLTGVGAAEKFSGKAYVVTLGLKKTIEPGTLETNVEINWQGLSRTVNVVYKRDFNAVDLIQKAELRIYDGNGNLNVEIDGNNNRGDYFDFLGGNQVTTQAGKQIRLYGVDKMETGDNIRNEGLHFPVMYGESEKRWKYEYTLTYKNPLGGTQSYEWAISAIGVKDVTITRIENEDYSSSGGTVKVKITCSNTDYNYQVGTLRFSVSPVGSDSWVPLNLHIYHTGFFHEEAGTYRQADTAMGKDNLQTGDFLYYEVLKEEGKDNYWLDRNLGARMNRMYIETNSPSVYTCDYDEEGNALTEAGGYRHGGYYGSFSNNTYNPANPYKSNLCPPGWEIPSKAVWADLRSSANMRTSQVGSYFDASLLMDGGIRMYFPKYGYYNGTTRQGNSRAGYYWTRTEADGLEKEHISHFLQVFVLEGTIPGFERAEVDSSNGGKDGVSMAVRCIYKNSARDTNEASTNRTYFNVSGATHVYLYTDDGNGNRTAATSWPGQFIGNYQNMTFDYDDPSYDQLFYLDYTSSTATAGDLYVIFNYTDSNGQIHTISRMTPAPGMSNAGTDSSARHTVNTSPTALYGWKIVGDNVNGHTTDVGGYWHCAYEGSDAKVIYGTSEVRYNQEYTIEWPQIGSINEDYWKVMVQYTDGTYPADFSGGKIQEGTWGGKNSFKYTFTKPISGSKDMIVRIYKADGYTKKTYTESIKKTKFTLQSSNKYYLRLSFEKDDYVDDGGNPVIVKYVTAYMYDVQNWGSVEVYGFDSATSTNPILGRVTQIATTQGLTGYKIEVPENSVSIAFYKGNDLTTSTGKISFNKNNDKEKVFFNYTNDTYKRYNRPASGCNRIVVFDNDNWTTDSGSHGVYIYNWDDNGEDKPWPGVKMNKINMASTGLSNQLYWADIPKNKFVVNNGVSDDEQKNMSVNLRKRQTNDYNLDNFSKGKVLIIKSDKYPEKPNI